jgi:hypothetical protein
MSLLVFLSFLPVGKHAITPLFIIHSISKEKRFPSKNYSSSYIFPVFS